MDQFCFIIATTPRPPHPNTPKTPYKPTNYHRSTLPRRKHSNGEDERRPSTPRGHRKGPRTAAHALDAPCAKDNAAFTFARTRPTTPARPTRIRHSARSGGGRSFQHREAANLKEPRNAAVRCLGVINIQFGQQKGGIDRIEGP
ncbi:hypothetical protein ABMA27_014138 [Loxostege sticticalis]|uniref:Uncharacterized protein n=1 Tax=Loxostege sticticalis TaxID=481309 RepID=A0ABR3ICV2_LOXSC